MTGLAGASGNAKHNSPLRLAQQEHLREIVELRKKGFSHQEIADITGRERSSISHLLGKWVKQMEASTRTELIAVESAKLDTLEAAAVQILRTFVPVVANGAAVYVPLDSDGKTLYDQDGKLVPVPLRDHGLVLQAIQTLLKIATRRATLLGLDAPAKSNVQVAPSTLPEITFNVIDAANGTTAVIPLGGATLQDAAAAEGVTAKEFAKALDTATEEAEEGEAALSNSEAAYLLKRYPQGAPAADNWFPQPVVTPPSQPVTSATLHAPPPAPYQLKP